MSGLVVGSLGASRIGDATARTRSGWGASRANLMAEIIAERLTGKPYETFTNAAMQWGLQTEAMARSAYEFHQDCSVTLTEPILHPSIKHSHASPDGLVGTDGLVEFKCPQTSTHLETLLGDEIDSRYVKQVQWQMAVTNRKWCDWVSFDPRLPDAMQFYCKRMVRDDEFIKQLESDVKQFLIEVGQKVSALREKYGDKAIAA